MKSEALLLFNQVTCVQRGKKKSFKSYKPI